MDWKQAAAFWAFILAVASIVAAAIGMGAIIHAVFGPTGAIIYAIAVIAGMVTWMAGTA